MWGTRRLGGKRLLVGICGSALSASLALFHGRLLWQRLLDGSLLQPVVVVRWGISALVVLTLLRLWSDGLPLLRGRRAGVVWLVVALLHAFTPGAPMPATEPVADGMLPAALAILALLAVGLGDASGSGQAASAKLFRPSRTPSAPADDGWYRVLFSRPPPVSLHP